MEDNLTCMMTKTLPTNKFNYGWTWSFFHLIVKLLEELGTCMRLIHVKVEVLSELLFIMFDHLKDIERM